MTRLTNDVDALNEMFTSGAISILGDVLTILGITILLLVINWQLALVTFVVMPPLFWIASFFRVAMRDNFRASRVRMARINAYIAENIGGMYIVQLFNREQRNFEQFDVLNRDYLHQTIRSLFFFISFSSITNFLSAVAIALIIWYGGGRVLVGALTIGAGKTSLISLISRFYDIQKGAILVDGIDVRNVRQKDLRKHVGAVLQDPFIFSGTITSNTRLHEEHISKLMLNRTSIIIAHRLSTIRNVDRIIVMHNRCCYREIDTIKVGNDNTNPQDSCNAPTYVSNTCACAQGITPSSSHKECMFFSSTSHTSDLKEKKMVIVRNFMKGPPDTPTIHLGVRRPAQGLHKR